MRLFLVTLASAAIAMASAPVHAHPGGHEGEYERAPSIPELARDSVVRLISQAKLPASWSTARDVRSFTRSRGGTEQLVVEFRNDAIRQRAKRSLFVIMTRGGQFISANHRLT